MILNSFIMQHKKDAGTNQAIGTYSSHVFSLGQVIQAQNHHYSIWDYQELIERIWNQLEPANIAGKTKIKTSKLKEFLEKQFLAINGSRFNEVMTDEILREAMINRWKGRHNRLESAGDRDCPDDGQEGAREMQAEENDSDFECLDDKEYVGKKNFSKIFRKALMHQSLKNSVKLIKASQ